MPALAEFIRADKTDIDEGRWQTGHITPSAFPMSRSRAKHYKFGPEYRWRVVRFRCLGFRCRVLIVMNADKHIFRSAFGVENDGDLVVLCSHEYHANHPGWHCHLQRASHDRLEPGIYRTGMRRWPQSRSRHARTEFGLSEASALSHVAERYRFKAQGDLL